MGAFPPFSTSTHLKSYEYIEHLSAWVPILLTSKHLNMYTLNLPFVDYSYDGDFVAYVKETLDPHWKVTEQLLSFSERSQTNLHIGNMEKGLVLTTDFCK